MLNSETFSEVLQEKMNEIPSESLLNAGWESVLDPMGLSQIIAEGPYHTIVRPHFAGKAYGLKARPAVVRPAHLLNEAQLAAFNDLSKWAPALNTNFTKRELKSAYRLSVLKTHPDKGGNSESFQEVKKSYQILEALVRNEA